MERGAISRDHGGGLDAAIAHYGGKRADWIDLSTGINPKPYPLPVIPTRFWQALPDSADQTALLAAARRFWSVPDGAEVIAASGVSALITTLPRLTPPSTVSVPQPTYNEHEASFRAFGWQPEKNSNNATAHVFVHPNNPTGRLWTQDEILAQHKTLTVIDESFCDTCPENSLVHLAAHPGFVLLKGLGKFWGLAGVRLGFAIAQPQTIDKLADMIGPWAISGPAQIIGKHALDNHKWAMETRTSLFHAASELDAIMAPHSKTAPQGTSLFRLYQVENAHEFHKKLAQSHILSRIFPYSETMIRLGLPGEQSAWERVRHVLE